MSKLIIEGGRPLQGSISLSGAKNASFKLMIASLLSKESVKLANVSKIADVNLTQEIIISLGGQVIPGSDYLTLDSASLSRWMIPESLGKNSRASSLFLGPLLARFHQAVVPFPGGDKIGQRPLDRHFEGLKSLGVNIELKGNCIYAHCHNLLGSSYTFPKPSHTGTETLIMAAVLASGRTILENCALEPEVDDLINFLNQMGAKIYRQLPRTIIIDGVASLYPVQYEVMPDRNEAVSYAVAAIITRGDLLVKNARPQDMAAFLAQLTKINAGYEITPGGIRFFYQGPLIATNIITAPHPGFMTDWQPLWSVLATQLPGESIITETIFPNRFQFVSSLQTMGATISYCHSSEKLTYNFNSEDDLAKSFHSIKIIGPSNLQGKSLTVTDIRAGATLALAGLVAKGKTTLTGIEHIDRGYENFAGRLLSLGAKIKRED